MGWSGDAGGRESDRDLFLLDTMGELTKAFALADVGHGGPGALYRWAGRIPSRAVAFGKGPPSWGPTTTTSGMWWRRWKGREVSASVRSPGRRAQALLNDAEAPEGDGGPGEGVSSGERQGATEKKRQNPPSPPGEENGAGGFPPISQGGRVRRWVTLALRPLSRGGGTSPPFSPGFRPRRAHLLPSPSRRRGGEVWSGVPLRPHGSLSWDARGTREQVAAAAAAAGLDFVVVGDHPPDDRKPGWEFWEPVVPGWGADRRGARNSALPRPGRCWWWVRIPPTSGGRGGLRLLRGDVGPGGGHGLRGPRPGPSWERALGEPRRPGGMQGWEVVDISEYARDRLVGAVEPLPPSDAGPGGPPLAWETRPSSIS